MTDETLIMRMDTGIRPRMKLGRNYNPYEHAQALQIQVLFRPLKKYYGVWMPDHHTIVIRSGLPNWGARATLAHEVAHATLGHRDSPPELEWAANGLAGWQMLGREGLEALARRVIDGGDASEVTQSFGVTKRMFAAVASPLSPNLIWPEGVPSEW